MQLHATAIACAAGALAACSERNLPHGYKYVIMNSYQAVVASGTTVVIDSDVQIEHVRGDKVFGVRRPEKGTKPVGEYGRFILDTATGAVTFSPASELR